jgi:hypothetical protein
LRIMTPRSISGTIAFIWLSSTLLALPSVFIYGEHLMVHWLVTVLITLIFPLGIISCCYVEILKISNRQQKRHAIAPQGEQTTASATRNIKNKKASITFAIVTAVFLVSFAPNLICNIIYAFAFTTCKNIPEYFYWTNSIMFTSSSLNPLIYGARNRDFRLAFRRYIMNIKC